MAGPADHKQMPKGTVSLTEGIVPLKPMEQVHQNANGTVALANQTVALNKAMSDLLGSDQYLPSSDQYSPTEYSEGKKENHHARSQRSTGDGYHALKNVAIDTAKNVAVDTADVGANVIAAVHYMPEALYDALNKITAYARKHHHYHGACATIVRQNFFQAAGIMSASDPHGAAFRYADFLERKGFRDIRSEWSESTAKPGDVVVFDVTKEHPSGHIQVMGKDGRWYSDCRQQHFLPNQQGFGNFHVYRTAEAPALAPTVVASADVTAPSGASGRATRRGHRQNHRMLSSERHFAGSEPSTPSRGRSHGRGHTLTLTS